MHSFIFAYVNGCAICQQMKNLPAHPVPPPLPIPSDPQAFPFSSVSMDFTTSLPMSQGFDAIVVFINHNLTKATVIAPCHSTITADETVSLYLHHVWKCFGLPLHLISDHRPQFNSAFF